MIRVPLSAVVTCLALSTVACETDAARTTSHGYTYSRTGAFLDFGHRPRSRPPTVILSDDGLPRVLFTAPPTALTPRRWPSSVSVTTPWGTWRARGGRPTTSSGRGVRHGGAWPLAFDYTLPAAHVELKGPWVSAMTQGQGMSLLTRMHRRTGQRKYLNAALDALTEFKPVASGGVVNKPPILRGRPFYEEYPTEPSILVLNGFMFTLLGLYDLAPYSHRAELLFERGYRTLLYALPLYDREGMSLYDLSNRTNRVPGHNYRLEGVRTHSRQPTPGHQLHQAQPEAEVLPGKVEGKYQAGPGRTVPGGHAPPIRRLSRWRPQTPR